MSPAKQAPGQDAKPGAHVFLRDRDGAHYAMPADHLAGYLVPEDAMVMQWPNGRTLVIPRDELEAFRLTDDEALVVAMHKRRTGPRRRGARRSAR